MEPAAALHLPELLEASRRELADAVAGISEADASRRPAAECWSVLECVEHVGLVEKRFFGWLEGGEKLDAPRVDPAKEEELQIRLADRGVKMQAPDPVLPAGRFGTLAEAMDHFEEARARTIAFARERRPDLYSLSLTHPRFGNLNGTEVLIIAAMHARRHADQIREIRAAIGDATQTKSA